MDKKKEQSRLIATSATMWLMSLGLLLIGCLLNDIRWVLAFSGSILLSGYFTVIFVSTYKWWDIRQKEEEG